LIAISCSGNSKNVINAAKVAKYYYQTQVISFTANDGGELKKLSDLNVNIDTKNIYVAESAHSMILHFLIDSLKD